MEKQEQVYSGIAALPMKDASDKIVSGCLVLEGGAFRGVYEEGVLDALAEEDYNFQCTIGVSAGALNAYNYVAGHIGRAAYTNLSYRHDDRYVGLTAMQNNHGVIGFDFLFESDDLPKFNQERFDDPNRRMIAVATNVLTGEPMYFEKGKCDDILSAIRASASMPYLSEPVEVDGIPCLDGGCSVKIPYQWALDEGFNKIVVIQTHAGNYRRNERVSFMKTAPLIYHKYPAFAKVLKESDARANRENREIEQLKKKGRIFVIRPTEIIHISRLEKDMEKLGNLYWLGYSDGKRYIPLLKEYLSSES